MQSVSSSACQCSIPSRSHLVRNMVVAERPRRARMTQTSCSSTPHRPVLCAAAGGEQAGPHKLEAVPVIKQQHSQGDSPWPLDSQQQEQQFKEVLAQVQQLPYLELQHLIDDQPEHRAFTASFLFWLSAQEKKADGQHKQQLAHLAAQLVQLKEQAEFHASRKMLPPLASSLAYSNYSQWRTSHNDQDLPEVTPGVPLSEFYKAAEQEEAKLKQWQSPNKPSSTLDNFAAASGYGSFAADAMARVRARLAGFEDDDTLLQPADAAGAAQSQADAGTSEPAQQQQGGHAANPAAERVLDELLQGCCCREERATLLPEACMSPGLEVSATGSASSSSPSTAPARVLTNPRRLQAAVAARMQQLQEHPQGQSSEQLHKLPSGEDTLQALLELQEDIAEYDTHVYSRMLQRDLQGL